MKQRNFKRLQVAYFYATVIATGLMTGLKIGGSITWSWWWITAPIWASFLLAFVAVSWAKWYLKGARGSD